MMLTEKLILSIDDSETIRTYLKSVLFPLGAVVEVAATAREGLEKCVAKPYDIILLDLLLPDANGIEVLRAIRRNDSSSTVIMITSHDEVKAAISAVQQGADGYLLKQELAANVHDNSEFLYAVNQAMEHRAGIIAQRQLEEIRADFYSMVTHDLRSPASIVYTALDMLADPDLGSLTPSQQNVLSQGQRALTKMLRLITNYLDYAKIDAGYLRLARTEFDLRQLIVDSAQLLALQVKGKNQTLSVEVPEVPVTGFVDADRLQQVLDNLLSNAYKYTPEGGNIAVTLTVDGSCAVFRISDSGIGIPPNEIPALFAKYHRVPGDATRKTLGTGLGLLIVKEIVGAHGGTIRAESDGIEGNGTTFIVNIPLRPSTAQSMPANDDWMNDDLDDFQPADQGSGDITSALQTELFEAFIDESRGQVVALRDTLRRLYQLPDNQQLLKTAQRLTHTLNGNAATMQAYTITERAAQMDAKLRHAVKQQLSLTSADLEALEQTLAEIDSSLTTE